MSSWPGQSPSHAQCQRNDSLAFKSRDSLWSVCAAARPGGPGGLSSLASGFPASNFTESLARPWTAGKRQVRPATGWSGPPASPGLTAYCQLAAGFKFERRISMNRMSVVLKLIQADPFKITITLVAAQVQSSIVFLLKELAFAFSASKVGSGSRWPFDRDSQVWLYLVNGKVRNRICIAICGVHLRRALQSLSTSSNANSVVTCKK